MLIEACLIAVWVAQVSGNSVETAVRYTARRYAVIGGKIGS